MTTYLFLFDIQLRRHIVSAATIYHFVVTLTHLNALTAHEIKFYNYFLCT